MKIFKTLSCSLAALCIMTACNKEQYLKIEESNLTGDLDKAFELVENEYLIEKDDNGEADATIKIKRTEVSVPYTNSTVAILEKNQEEAALCNVEFEYTFYNEKGDEMDVDFEVSRKQELELLKLQPGESGKLTFNFDDAEKLPASVSMSSKLKFNNVANIRLDGSIDKYTVKNFDIDVDYKNKTVDGKYQYNTSAAGAYLFLDGNIDNMRYNEKTGNYTWDLTMTEDNGAGMLTGDFVGELMLKRDNATSPYYYIISGKFTNFQLKTFLYDLKSASLDELYEAE